MSEGFPTDGMELTRLLVVSDLQRSSAWYREVLGADVVRVYDGDSVVLHLLGGWLLLVAGNGPTRDKPNVTFAPPADANRASAGMIVRVPNCQAAYQALRLRGAQFLTPPVRWEHGEVRAYFRDPDGHLFEINQMAG